MLVLSRKEKERVLIGDEIAITIVRVAGNKVRIGFEAPHHIAIRREELTVVEGCDMNKPAATSPPVTDAPSEGEALWPLGL